MFPAWLQERKRASVMQGILHKAAKANIPTKRVRTPNQIDENTAIVVASHTDELFLRRRVPVLALLEHGLGQIYKMDRSKNWIMPGGRGA